MPPTGASDHAASGYGRNAHAGGFGLERFSIDRDRGCLLEYVRAAQGIGDDLDFFASPWSPPTWMKDPPNREGHPCPDRLLTLPTLT